MAEKYKLRIVKSGWVDLAEIQFNPYNWRIHTLEQQNYVKGIIEKVGWVKRIMVNVQTGNVIDGHLRCSLAKTIGETRVPVDWIDVSPEEEKLILATLDKLPGYAVTDAEQYAMLLSELDTEEYIIGQLVEDIILKENLAGLLEKEATEIDFNEFTEAKNQHFLYRVVVEGIETRDEAIVIAEKIPNAEVIQYRVSE